jgi:hypothetical protein
LVGFPSFVGERPPDSQVTNSAVMKGSWADPLDHRPNASRNARDFRACRRFCPQRRSLARRGSCSNPFHAIAADEPRACYDASRLGFTG